MLKLFRKKIFFWGGITLVLASCVKIYTGKDIFIYRNISGNGEKIEHIVFAENNFGANIKWKKNIGTSISHLFDRRAYIVESDPAILSDNKIYFQDQSTIFAADLFTGEIRDKYDKPENQEKYIADLASASYESDKIAVLWSHISADEPILFLKIDHVNKSAKIVRSWGAPHRVFYAKGKIIGFQNQYPLVFAIFVQEFDSSKKPWWDNIAGSLYSLEVGTDNIIVIYGKGDVVFIEVRNLDTGETLWKNQFKAEKSADKTLYNLTGIKNFIQLQKSNELFVAEYLAFNGNTGQLTQNVISLDPRTGQINWQLSDVGRVYTKRYGDDGLFYFYKRDQPETLYGVDQKTGEEKLKLSLRDPRNAQGIISTPDKIFYPRVIDRSKDTPLPYDTFSAVDKKTGKTLWTVNNIDRQFALPHYENGILYFGYRNDFYRNLLSGTIKQYERSFDLLSPDDVPTVLQKTAFAVDAETGKVLWKVKLEGREESYVEKILVKDNMAFIKSLSGWLYAIEWGKSAPKAQ